MRGRRLLFFLSALVASAWADYFVDDTNTTLTYSSGPKAAWGPFAAGGSTLELLLPNNTYQSIDPYSNYRILLTFLLQSIKDAACYASDSCLLTIPFTGSGITIYVYQAGPVGINASITVDGAHAATNVLNAAPAPNYEISNVSMFDVQQLQTGTHSLNLLINDMLGSYSGMMFDYAYINETLVTSAPTSTGSSTATSTSTPSPSSNSSSGSSTNVGPIVGGVLGGLAVVAAGIIAFFCIRRRKSKKDALDLSSEGVVPYNPHAAYDPPHTSQLPSTITYADSGLNNTASLSHMPLSPNRRNDSSMNVTTPPVASVVTPFTSSTSTSSSGQDRKSRLALVNDTSDAVLPSSDSALSAAQLPPDSGFSTQNIRSHQNPSQSLTDEQADFINTLYNNNVPATAIARVMERMLADRHAGIREWERETRLARSNTISTAPPGYYDDPSAEQGI
ncbi:hypothetical protein F5I97DRAFT_1924520 [Phlebopus sp. FC_14]|nr:hypothetical protein F5I97DRAFT_1924520 [Phlebopus sp. FC_14]